MSKRITFQAVDWGTDFSDHIEAQWQGEDLFIDISDEEIKILANYPVEVDTKGNGAVIRPANRELATEGR